MEILLRNFRNPSCVGTLIYLIYMCFFFGIPTTPIQHTKSIQAWRWTSYVTRWTCCRRGVLKLEWPASTSHLPNLQTVRVCLVGGCRKKVGYWPSRKRGGIQLTRCPCWIVCLPKQAERRDFFGCVGRSCRCSAMKWKTSTEYLERKLQANFLVTRMVWTYSRRERERERERVRHWVISWF